jgi:hypothetical protein
MRVFKVNDYDWVAANSEKEAKEWYMNEFKLSEEDAFDDFHEVDIDKEWMWFCWDDLPEEEKEWTVTDGKMIGGEFFVKRNFRWVIEHRKIDSPCIIASTEY